LLVFALRLITFEADLTVSQLRNPNYEGSVNYLRIILENGKIASEIPEVPAERYDELHCATTEQLKLYERPAAASSAPSQGNSSLWAADIAGADPRLLLLAAAVMSVAAARPPPAVAAPSSWPPPPPPCPPDPGAGRSLERQLEALAAHLAGPRSTAPPPRTTLPRVYGWLVTPAGRRRVKCLLDSGA